jgi:sialate O-acetylesterase
MKKAMLFLTLAIMFAFTAGSLRAEVTVHNMFDQNMVLQRGKPVEVRGRGDVGESVTVTYSGQTKKARADDKGNWSIKLDALKASAEPKDLVVSGRSNSITLKNVVVGDIWLCGGQSNMEDVLENIYHGDIEVVSANHPNIRLMTIPQVAVPEALTDIQRLNEFNSWTGRHEMKGSWAQCTPETVNRFSAIGYIFGRRLHLASGVPIGLIDASRGGTTIEAWTSRTKLATIPESKGLTDEWDQQIAAYDPAASLKAEIQYWEEESERRKQRGEEPEPKPTEPDPATDPNNPGASLNGMIAPIAGFNIKGVIFNQGYNNALGNARPRLYAKVIKAMIEDWRRAFRDESMPFGIIGLTAGGQPQTLENFELRMVDPAPFIREGQFKAAQELENVCFMPAYDQQVPWYHPHTKFELGERTARWALNTQYGYDRIGWKPAVCTGSENKGDHFILTFDRTVQVDDGRPLAGFAIAGEDRHFVPARAEYVVVGKDERGEERTDERQVKVWSALVQKPLAVRYAWARNPLGNMVNSEHHERVIPIPSFRTDDWDWPEAPFRSDGGEAEEKHGERRDQMRRNAQRWLKERIAPETR